MFLSAALLTALSAAAASAHLPAIRIALTLDPALPAGISRLATEEAAAIWKPYGVAIVTPAPAPDRAVTILTVRLHPGLPAPGTTSTPFAAVRFFGGVPEPTLLLYYDAITTVALKRAEEGDIRASRWPQALRDRMTARLIGRALAHEIGHWLLRTTTHSPTGLMRATHPTSDLLAAHRQHFTLAAQDVTLLGDAVRRLRASPGQEAKRFLEQKVKR
jgi:hypothetical protein